MTDKRVALLAQLNRVVAEVSQLADQDGVSVEQREHVLAVLREYAASLENPLPTTIDCNRVARFVVEYWPMNLAVGERVISIEQELREFNGKAR
ncbi:hypothetical protein [Cupriavidus numazuensis]|uniref:hypothetical protein n=1 Tax=Cupriavidus numazuensis TaxID=221992 RepID=UPI001BAA6E61|nr:hypothetical protein [Cupriavidus numazuensis]